MSVTRITHIIVRTAGTWMGFAPVIHGNRHRK